MVSHVKIAHHRDTGRQRTETGTGARGAIPSRTQARTQPRRHTTADADAGTGADNDQDVDMDTSADTDTGADIDTTAGAESAPDAVYRRHTRS